jgi:phosphotransferase system  glucose/maltose/N-acetylglucosamine-specific IIC component
MKTVVFYVSLLLLIIFSVQLADLFLVDVLRVETRTNMLWLPVILLLGPGLVLTIGYSISLYRGESFKQDNRLAGGYTGGIRAISDFFQLILEVLIPKEAIKKAKGNVRYSAVYGLLISLIEIGIVALVVMTTIKVAGGW